MVLYRKYRPQKLSEIIGQETAKKIILDAWKSKKLSHAYLFVGPRGTGKTSTARILAKMVNCLEKDAPCNKCGTCISITDGSNLDLIEIDAASNRGIDDVRALRENIKLSPSGKGKKVYIIDEVHMLTTEAFNALLKTLEEPPAHVLFILATTEVNKIPATILSRVTRIDFRLASVLDLIKALELICIAEGIEVEPEALQLLAKKADGSFRDVVKLLDQLAGIGKISLKDVSDGLAVASSEGISEILDNLSKKDATRSLRSINAQIEVGVGVKELTLQLMEALRELVFLKSGIVVEEKYGQLKNAFSMTGLVDLLNKLQGSCEKLKFASIPSLPLELVIVEVCGGGSSGLKAPLGTPLPETLNQSQDLVMDSSRDVPPARETSSIDLDAQTSPSPTGEDASILKEKWTFILETIRQDNFSLEALLRSAKIISCAGGAVILEVPYSFHQRILEAPKSKNLLESVLREVLQRPIKVVTTLKVRPQKIEDLANIEVAADDEIITLAADIFSGKLVD